MEAGRHFASGERRAACGEAASNEERGRRPEKNASPPGFPRFVCSLQSYRSGFVSFAHSRDKLPSDQKGTAGSLVSLRLITLTSALQSINPDIIKADFTEVIIILLCGNTEK